MNLVNKTPHAIALRQADGSVRILEPELPPVRIKTRTGDRAWTLPGGIELYHPSDFLGLTGVPDRRPETLFIVSQLAALAISATMKKRTDFAYPANGPDSGAKRDERGVLSVGKLILAA